MTFTVQTIKGVAYAVFTAQAGPYVVSYGADVTAGDFGGLGFAVDFRGDDYVDDQRAVRFAGELRNERLVVERQLEQFGAGDLARDHAHRPHVGHDVLLPRDLR